MGSTWLPRRVSAVALSAKPLGVVWTQDAGHGEQQREHSDRRVPERQRHAPRLHGAPQPGRAHCAGAGSACVPLYIMLRPPGPMPQF